MEKLNELDDLFLLVNSKNNPFDNYSTVKDKTILAIAEAFQALEQRAEAAEAKLAELEKQKPVAYVMGEETIADFNSGYEFFAVRDAEHEEELESIPLFTRPAPAINLAELMPGDIPKDVYQVIYQECGGFVDSNANAQTIWNACLAGILRNIDEAK